MRSAFWLSFPRLLKQVLAGARRWYWHMAALLRLWVEPEQNPFLQRALRVEQRKRKPFLNVALLMSFIALTNGGLWWFWTWLLGRSPAIQNLYASYELPPALGSNVLNGAAIFSLLCCVVTAIYMCASRSAQNLRREMLGGTLEQLVLLPQREERWLWLMRAQPLALSLLIFACGLPIFLLAVFTNNWNSLDIIGLLFLFVAIGHWAPTWTPLQWQARQNAGQKFDLRAWQAAVKALQQEGKAAKGEAATLEMQRRMGRLWEKMEPVTDTNTPEGKKRLLVGAGGVGGNAGNNWRFSWIFLFQLIGPGINLLRIPGNPLGALWFNLLDALPLSVLQMAPAFPITWPLLLARVLWAPLPFFALALPPILLYLPLWLARQVGGNLQLASMVSPGETFWTTRRLRTRRLCVRWSLGCGLLMLLGYSWTTLIDDAVLAPLLRGAPATPPWALATLFTLCVIVGVLVAGEAKEKPFKRHLEKHDGNQTEVQAAEASETIAPIYVPPSIAVWREAARWAVGYFALAIVAYGVFCLLGQRPFFSVPFNQRLWPVLATAFAYLIADYGSSALQAALPEASRSSCKNLVTMWTLGLGLITVAYIVAGFYYRRPFTFDQAPFVVLSPLVTMLALLRFDLNGGVPWWIGPLLQTLIGAALLLSAALKTFGTAPVQAPVLAESEEGRLPSPLRWLRGVLLGVWGGVVSFFEGCTELVRRADDGLVQWSKRFGNPILSEELQRRLRREHWPLGWCVLALMALGFFVQGVYFVGTSLQGRYVGGIALGAMFVLGFFSCLRLGMSFDRDRANGTLVFVFLTPLTEKEIAWGKLLSNLLYTGGTLLILLPFLLIGIVLESAMGDAKLALAGALCFLFLLSLVAYFSSVSFLCASGARKPTQGAALAFLVGLVGQLLFFLPAFLWAYFADNSKPSLSSETFIYGVGYFVFSLNCAATFFAWQGALRFLRKQRYSDDVTRGKGTG